MTGTISLNPPHRKCSRDGCQNFATQSKGGAIWAKLCSVHNTERRARQDRSRSQTKCSCGNAAPMDATKCRRCAEKDEVYQAQQSTARKLSGLMERLRSLSLELNRDETTMSAAADEIYQIVDGLEYIQAVI